LFRLASRGRKGLGDKARLGERCVFLCAIFVKYFAAMLALDADSSVRAQIPPMD
jgi:hypothetical protein